MRFSLVLIFALMCAFFPHGAREAAAREVSLTNAAPGSGPALVALDGDRAGCELRFTLPALQVEDVVVDGATRQALSIEGGILTGRVGDPGLPSYAGFVAVPAGHAVTARATAGALRTLEAIRPLAVQPDPEDDYVASARAAAPASGGEMVVLGEAVVMHGVRLVPFTVHPLTWDPVDERLTAATEIDLSFDFVPQGGDDAPPAAVGESFDRMLAHVAPNWANLRESVEVGPGTYLIIMPNNAQVVAAVQPLVDWRKRQGYHVLAATTAQTGTTASSIKSYIQNIYNTVSPPLEHVSLVGDATGTVMLPTWNEQVTYYQGEGDHYYTTLEGGDILADVNVGRLTVRNVTELTTVVNKILGYETDPPRAADPGWFGRATLVGDPSSSGETTIYCQQWLRAQLERLGYSDIDSIYNSPFASQMFAATNLGATVFGYRGFIGVSGFSTGYIDALTNGGELPYAVLPTCSSGSFKSSTHTYSEAFLRNPNGGGIGAIGTATPGTHTRYNNCYFAGVWEGVLNTGARHLGAGHTYGKLELYRNFGAWEATTVEAWSVWNNLMGDPATEMWQGLPAVLTVAYPSSLPVGAGAVPIVVTGPGGPVAGARIAITKGDEVRAVGYSDAAGQVVLPLPGSQTAGSLLVTVTGADLLPHRGAISLGAVDAFAALADFSVNDAARGDGNGQANPSEGLTLSLALTNLGAQTAGAVLVALTSEDPAITVEQGLASFGDIAAGATVWGGPFAVTIAPTTPDGHVAALRVTAISGDEDWVSLLELPIVAAAPTVAATTWSPSPGGALPGQVGDYRVTLHNDGSRAIGSGVVSLVSESPFVMPAGPAEANIGAVAVGGSVEVVFPLAIADDAFGGHLAALRLAMVTAEGSEHVLGTTLAVGTAGPDSPCGPDAYGYLAYDNLDPSPDAPAYAWVEIDPTYGGLGASVGLTDFGYEQDDTETLALPFTFSYYGEDFDSLAICSNGWIAMGATTLVPFHNLTLPSANCPDALIAVFWDDLRQSGTNKVYTYHDAAGGRYIVQWSRMRNDNNGQQNCEVILYDPAQHPTATGDGLIVMQYAQVANNDYDRAYCTTGIQNLDGTTGVTYTYYNSYAPGARTLAAGRAIAFVPTANVGADHLQVAPERIEVELAAGEQQAAPLTLSAAGAEGTVLHYAVSIDAHGGDAAWLTVVPTTGTIAAGAAAHLTVSLDATGLTDGLHAADLVIANTAGSPVVVPVELFVGISTAVDDVTPRALALAPALPNPFNPRTVLGYAVPAPGRVQLAIHDLSGRRLAVLVDEVRPAGSFEAAWNGTDDAGRRLPSGTYVARLVAGGEARTQKLILVK